MNKRTIKSFEEAVGYINEIPRFTSKHTLEDTRNFLHHLGDPDSKMKIIHVAGTNGKGSVCAYLRSILEAAGYRVAIFTSPHLVDIRERFVSEGEMITEKDFLRIFLSIYERLDWENLEDDRSDVYHPSYFEYLFFMAMVYFQERQPDYCILETGLGGRLDATNAVSKKELSVITRIGLDHVEYLGDTLEQIAAEKAGIMMAGVPAVCWDTNPATSRVFADKAAKLGISADFVSENDYRFLNFINKTIDFSLNTRYYGYISLSLHTIAAYQMENAAMAVRALEVLDRGQTLKVQQIQAGITACFWAGRMEEVLPDVYVDGAHNADGIRAFLETVARDGHGQDPCGGSGKRSLLFSAVKDKDYESMAKALAGSMLFDKIVLAPLKSERRTSTQTLKKIFSGYGSRCVVCDSVAEAFHNLLAEKRDKERIYVAGSLYLAGEIKELVRDDKF